MRLQIIKVHLPSRKAWRVHVEVDSEAQMLRHINVWNRQAPGTWVYWLDPPPQPQITYTQIEEVPTEFGAVVAP